MGGKLGGRRMTLAEADSYAEVFREMFWKTAIVHVTGSTRRRCQEVSDLDLVILPNDGQAAATNAKLIELFGHLKSSKKKPKRSGLYDDIQVDVLVATEENLGTHLMHFTGSQAENIRLRGIARARGWKLSQLGVFDGTTNLAAGMSEEEVYRLLGERFVRPEDR